MDTPIRDFVNKYIESDAVRAHMPGHKGKSFIGLESLDLTEIDGADDLFNADGIIAESEKNASEIFGADTFYSTEGSTLSIKAMLFLATKYAINKGIKPVILAGRNAHKSFLNAAALIGFDIEWILPKDCSYLSCNITANDLLPILSNPKTKPVAVYITAPDYLGNTVDIKALADVCKTYGVLLLVDNAHGAYLKFLTPSIHPIDLGATACCDSAHKTLPALTGGGYLHISKDAPEFFKDNAKNAMALFGSTSPSYLILQSLDILNKYLYNDYKLKLSATISRVENLKSNLINSGYSLIGREGLKITLDIKKYGYTGIEFSVLLKDKGVFIEFCDPDYVVLMLSTETSEKEFNRLENALIGIPKKTPILTSKIQLKLPKKALSVRDALLSPSEIMSVENSLGRIISNETVACPPAVPVIVSGEVVDENTIKLFNYYQIKTCSVIKE